MSKTSFVSSIKEIELKECQMKPVRVKGRPILLVRQGRVVYGVSNRCPHMGCFFEGGILTGFIVLSSCHGWKFDVRNGQYQEIKEVELECYRCKIENGKIHVEIKNNE